MCTRPWKSRQLEERRRVGEWSFQQDAAPISKHPTWVRRRRRTLPSAHQLLVVVCVWSFWRMLPLQGLLCLADTGGVSRKPHVESHVSPLLSPPFGVYSGVCLHWMCRWDVCVRALVSCEDAKGLAVWKQQCWGKNDWHGSTRSSVLSFLSALSGFVSGRQNDSSLAEKTGYTMQRDFFFLPLRIERMQELKLIFSVFATSFSADVPLSFPCVLVCVSFSSCLSPCIMTIYSSAKYTVALSANLARVFM